MTAPLSGGRRLRLVNGRFLDGGGDGWRPVGTSLIIDGDRIARLDGPGAAGQGEPCLDLGGRHVIPGLFNTHCHAQMTLPSLLAGARDLYIQRRHAAAQVNKNMADCLEAGVTVIRDAWSESLAPGRSWRQASGPGRGPRYLQAVLVSPLGGAFAPQRDLRERIMFGALGMPFVPYRDPDSGVVAFDPGASAVQVKDAIDRAIDERGADCIKLYDQRERRLDYRPGARLMTPKQLAAAVDRARARGLPVTMHHLTVESFRRGLAAGVTSLAHLPYDRPLQETDLRSCVDAGLIVEPTLSLAFHFSWPGAALAGHPALSALGKLRAACLDSLFERFWLPAMGAAALRGIARARASKFRAFGLWDLRRVYDYYGPMATLGCENLGRLFEAGALLACGTDAGAVPLTPAMIGLELAMISTMLAALPGGRAPSGSDLVRMATCNSARALGLEGDQGSITVGHLADLAVVDRDPLADPECLGLPVAALLLGGELIIDRCGLGQGRAVG